MNLSEGDYKDQTCMASIVLSGRSDYPGKKLRRSIAQWNQLLAIIWQPLI